MGVHTQVCQAIHKAENKAGVTCVILYVFHQDFIISIVLSCGLAHKEEWAQGRGRRVSVGVEGAVTAKE